MKREEFKEWLLEMNLSTKTANSRLSNCATIEHYYGNLETHFKKDKCRAIIEELEYSADDEREKRSPRHKIPIEGNVRTGSSTLRQAIRRYVEFCEFEVAMSNLLKVV